MTPLQITLSVLGLVIIAFLTGKVPYSIICIGTMVLLILSKVLTPAVAFGSFANTNVIMFGAMFVIGAGITKTSLLGRIKKLVIGYKAHPRTLIALACIASALVAIITSSTATGAIMLPFLLAVAKEAELSGSRLLFPAMACANIATGMTMLGQGASNMAWSDIMIKSGGKVPFEIWDFTIARMPMLLVTVVYMVFIGYKLLPDHSNSELSANIHEKDISLKLSPTKEKIAMVIIAATIISMLMYKQIGVEMYIPACVGAALLVITGVLSENEALGSFHMPTIFLFAGVLTLSSAISSTGAGKVVADLIIRIIGNSTNPYVIMATFFIVPLILTQVMSNLAVITIFIPLAAVTAVQIGVDPRAAVMGTLIAGCTSLLTPMASPVQAMIMGPGKYKMTDYIKSGLPITIIITFISIIWLPFLYPFV